MLHFKHFFYLSNRSQFTYRAAFPSFFFLDFIIQCQVSNILLIHHASCNQIKKCTDKYFFNLDHVYSEDFKKEASEKSNNYSAGK